MPRDPETGRPRVVARSSAALGAAAGLIGLSVQFAQSRPPGWSTMSALTALCLVLFGASLALLTFPGAPHRSTTPQD